MIHRQMLPSYMNDTKWRKVFKHINDSEYHIETSYWKFIDSERIIENQWPPNNCLLNSCFEDGVKYKLIHWIEIPKHFKRKPYQKIGYNWEHDIEGISNKIMEIGKFQLELTTESLTIFGYKK